MIEDNRIQSEPLQRGTLAVAVSQYRETLIRAIAMFSSVPGETGLASSLTFNFPPAVIPHYSRKIMTNGSSGGPTFIYNGNDTPILIETHKTSLGGPYYGNPCYSKWYSAGYGYS